MYNLLQFIKFEFRTTPVPYTGNKRWRFKHYYKKPKTTQEKRWSFVDIKYVRGKRRSHILPDAWDDYPRSDIHGGKSWKRKKKKKQWM